MGGATALLAAGLISAAADGAAKEQIIGVCMRNLGYTQVPLTNDENLMYRRIFGDSRAEWEDAFYATADLPARIEAERSRYPALPAAREDFGPVGAFRLQGLTAVVEPGQPIAQGP